MGFLARPGSSRQFAIFDRSVSLAILQVIATRAVRFLPSLAKVGVIRSYAGLRPWSPDHLPLIGPLAAMPGFYLATRVTRERASAWHRSPAASLPIGSSAPICLQSRLRFAPIDSTIS